MNKYKAGSDRLRQLQARDMQQIMNNANLDPYEHTLDSYEADKPSNRNINLNISITHVNKVEPTEH